MIERIVDGVTIVALLLLLLPLLPGADWVRYAIGAGGLVFGLLLLVAMAIARARGGVRRIWARLAVRLPPGLRTRLASLIVGGLDGVARLFAARVALSVGALSIWIWLVGAGIYLAVAAAFGIAQSLWWWVACICLVNLATSLPLTPAGLGAFELVLSELLRVAGVPPDRAAAMTLTLHAVLVVPVVLAGMGSVWYWGLSFDPLRRGAVGDSHAAGG